MSNFHCCSGDVSLETRFYLSLQFGSNSLFSLGNDAFSAMCEVCKKAVQPVSWGTNTVRWLYSFWVLFVCTELY